MRDERLDIGYDLVFLLRENLRSGEKSDTDGASFWLNEARIKDLQDRVSELESKLARTVVITPPTSIDMGIGADMPQNESSCDCKAIKQNSERFVKATGSVQGTSSEAWVEWAAKEKAKHWAEQALDEIREVVAEKATAVIDFIAVAEIIAKHRPEVSG